MIIVIPRMEMVGSDVRLQREEKINIVERRRRVNSSKSGDYDSCGFFFRVLFRKVNLIRNLHIIKGKFQRCLRSYHSRLRFRLINL